MDDEPPTFDRVESVSPLNQHVTLSVKNTLVGIYQIRAKQPVVDGELANTEQLTHEPPTHTLPKAEQQAVNRFAKCVWALCFQWPFDGPLVKSL